MGDRLRVTSQRVRILLKNQAATHSSVASVCNKGTTMLLSTCRFHAKLGSGLSSKFKLMSANEKFKRWSYISQLYSVKSISHGFRLSR